MSQTYTVTSSIDDDGSTPGTLRYGILLSREGNISTIIFNISGSNTITLIADLPRFTTNVTLNGKNMATNQSIIINGNNKQYTIFNNTKSTIEANYLNLTNSKCAITNNNSGSFTINYCTLDTNNQAVQNNNGTTTINYCTISNNTGSNCILNNDRLYINVSTINTNITNSIPITLTTGSSAVILDSTIINSFNLNGNSAIYAPGNNIILYMGNTIVSNNSPINNAYEIYSIGSNNFFYTFGNNFIDSIYGFTYDVSHIIQVCNSDRIGSLGSGLNPQLSPLADNGGPTPTMAPFPESPVIGAGCLTIATDNGISTDQRGIPLILNVPINIGAYNGPPSIVPPPTVTPSKIRICYDTKNVYIYGLGFSPVAANNTVIFNGGTRGTVVAASPTKLQIKLTNTARLGELLAQVTSNNVSSDGFVQVATVINCRPCKCYC